VKPILNLDELTFESEESGKFQQKWGVISDKIGAKRLGYNLTIVPPGKSACPFHNHHHEEEMFFILEGTGTLRFGDKEYPLRAHDVIACPTGGRETAHQILNTGNSDLKYLSLSTRESLEICEYPDSNKVGVFAGPQEKRIRLLFKIDQSVDYYDGEC
jgi:uncharacterized cupin superfamily protein